MKKKSKDNRQRQQKYQKSTLSNLYVYKKKKKPKRLGKDCKYFNSTSLICNTTGKLCVNASACFMFKLSDSVLKEKETQPKNIHIIPNYTKSQKKHTHEITDVGITAIVLNDNRKCINSRHNIQDIRANIRIATTNQGIITSSVLAGYCKECDAYFILKNDFKAIKKQGIILCPVIDRTQTYLNKNAVKVSSGNESEIHQLGYNVKKNNGYTKEQRQYILANIVENTRISKYEIVSNIRRCIAQHKNQVNYSQSVKCWTDDLEFILKYKHGDLPEVLIGKIIVGKRER